METGLNEVIKNKIINTKDQFMPDKDFQDKIFRGFTNNLKWYPE